MLTLLKSTALDALKEEFKKSLLHFSENEQSMILDAVDWAQSLHQGQIRASGEPYIIHPIQVAHILSSLKMDALCVCAGILHDVLEDTEVTKDSLRERYGKEVEMLVNGVTKIDILHAKTKSVQEAETIRKMFFAMIKDIRVIFIKLADKVHNMSTLEHLPPHKVRRIANECLDIYAPLAGRLGMSTIKSRLEDLALKHLDKASYYQLKNFVSAKQHQRERFLQEMEKALRDEAEKLNISISIETRAKHFYSIYNKQRKKGHSLEEIHDILGIRVFCEDATHCYTLLGLCHKLWRPIEGRFKDYIAMPKSNGYQSLHTTVMSTSGQKTEIQIRTYDMHQTAEYGVAAHWVYKKGGTVNSDNLAIVKKMKSWRSQPMASRDFLDDIKRELLKDTIYVFTPKGKVIELPKGSTAIDFSYAIHTEVGHHTIAAKGDGSIVPLGAELKNTQTVEILTSPNARPHVNWLRQVRTHRARSKIRHWLNHHDEHFLIDKNIVAKKKQMEEKEPAPVPKAKNNEPSRQVVQSEKIGIKMGDERNMMIRFARCCEPVTGDPIVGFVSRGRGLIIHRQDCKNLSSIPNMDQREVEVEWETVSPRKTQRFQIRAKKSSDLFSEIEGAVRKFKGHLLEGKLEDDHNGGLFGNFTMEIERTGDLTQILKAIRSIPSVSSISKI